MKKGERLYFHNGSLKISLLVHQLHHLCVNFHKCVSIAFEHFDFKLQIKNYRAKRFNVFTISWNTMRAFRTSIMSMILCVRKALILNAISQTSRVYYALVVDCHFIYIFFSSQKKFAKEVIVVIGVPHSLSIRRFWGKGERWKRKISSPLAP